MLKSELELFFLALTFLTRVSSPIPLSFSPERLNGSARYYPLVGLLLGAASATLYLAMISLNLPAAPAVVITMAFTAWVTGAFHEDGLADFLDGFGGGWLKNDTLEIMKDSRSGAFAVIGTSLNLLLKASALAAMPSRLAAAALVTGHTVSRFAALTFLRHSSYVREDGTSKVRPLAQSISTPALAFAALPAMAASSLVPPAEAGLALICLAGTTLYLRKLMHKRLGGFTGDCLGAVQQLAESSWYLGLLIGR